MLLMNNSFCSFKLTLFLLIYLNSVAFFSHGSITKVEKQKFHVLHLHHSPVTNLNNCSAHKTGKVAHKMELLYAYGPCSPFPNSVQLPSKDEMLLRNEGRVRRINRRNPNSRSYSTVDEADGKSVGNDLFIEDDQYITTIGLGTPKYAYHVMIDTGSDSTWVHCTQCLEGCTTDLSPLYDPMRSLSYRNGSTKFSERYGDDTSASGIWSFDILTLGSNQVIEGFRFGCAQQILAEPYDFAGHAGVLGLGRGDDSLASQSSEGQVFAYCLPKSQHSRGYLVFGDEARTRISNSPTMQFTHLINAPPAVRGNYFPDSYYFLQLVGISVAGNQLNIPPQVFTSVGTVIDCGTVVSHLPKEAYAALASAFNHSMFGYQRAPPPPGEVLDTCFYINSERSMVIPSVTFYFAGGADVDLDESGIGWTSEKEKNIWCLGFTESKEGELTIIGNTQQKGMEIVYDINGGMIGFDKKNCEE